MNFRAEVIVRSSKYLLCSGMSRKCQSASFGRAVHFTRGNSPPTVGAVNYASKHTRAYARTDKKTSHSLLYQLVQKQQWARRMKRRNRQKKKERWGARTLTSNQGSRLLNLSQRVPSDKTQHAAQHPPFTEYLTSHQPLSSIAFNNSSSVSFLFFPLSFSLHLILPHQPCPLRPLFLSLGANGWAVGDSLILMQHLHSGRVGASAVQMSHFIGLN